MTSSDGGIILLKSWRIKLLQLHHLRVIKSYSLQTRYFNIVVDNMMDSFFLYTVPFALSSILTTKY